MQWGGNLGIMSDETLTANDGSVEILSLSVESLRSYQL